MTKNILSERTTENLSVLNDFVNVIVNNLPYAFTVGSIHEEEFGSMRGYTELKAKYKDTKYQNIIDGVKYLVIRIMNNENIKSDAGGVVSSGKAIVKVYYSVSNFLGEVRNISSKELLSIKREAASIKTFRAVILHELRHVFQFYQYNKFYTDNRTYTYDKDPLEIDAAWFHHISDFNVSDYDDIHLYVKDVIKSFDNYKSLSEKQKEHYIRKTAKYWVDHHRNKDDHLANSRDYKDVIQKQYNIVKSKILSSISEKSYNLKDYIPKYRENTPNFIIGSHIVSGVKNIISSGVPYKANKNNICLVYLLVALAVDKSYAPTARKYLENVLKISMTDAIESMTALSDNKFDSVAIERFVRNILG